MFCKAVVATALLTAFSVPAFAATDYWVGQNATTHKCEVVNKKPDGTKMMNVGNKTYKTKSSAEKAMKQLAACK
jgi:hypothetical protein